MDSFENSYKSKVDEYQQLQRWLSSPVRPQELVQEREGFRRNHLDKISSPLDHSRVDSMRSANIDDYSGNLQELEQSNISNGFRNQLLGKGITGNNLFSNQDIAAKKIPRPENKESLKVDSISHINTIFSRVDSLGLSTDSGFNLDRLRERSSLHDSFSSKKI